MRKHEMMLTAGWVENPVWRHFTRREQQDPNTRRGHRLLMTTVGLISSVVAIYTLSNGGGWWGFLGGGIALVIFEALFRLGHVKEVASVGEKYPRYICPEDARHVRTFEAWEKAFQQLVHPPRDEDGWMIWPAREVELAVGRAGGQIPNATSVESRTDAEWLTVAREALDAANAMLHRVYPALWPSEESDLRLARDAIRLWLSDQVDIPATEEWRARNALENIREAYRDIVAGRLQRNSGSVIQSRAILVRSAIRNAYDVREERSLGGRYKIKQDVLPAKIERTPSLPGPQRPAFADLVELLNDGVTDPALLEVSLELLDMAKRWDGEQLPLPRTQVLRTAHALNTLEGDVRRIVDAPELLQSASTREELVTCCRAVIDWIHACFGEHGNLLERDVELSLRALRQQIAPEFARTL